MEKTAITLKPGKEQSLHRFHPWVFSGAIHSMTALAQPGEEVEVYSSKNELLGTGHFAEGSITVRLFAFGDEKTDQPLWTARIQSAFDARMKCGLVDRDDHNIYRLVHAEGDGLPGVIIDIYGKTAVIQAHSLGMYLSKEKLVTAIQHVLGNRITAIYDKSEEKLLRNSGVRADKGYLVGSEGDPICKEYNNLFKVDWVEGQKTGFFIDQRENRRLLGEYAHGKKVLNTFCYTGGFSVFALKGGATLVHSLDSSQKALDLTVENVALNGNYTDRHDVIKADAVEYMKNLKEDYDIIVLDPPAFAKNLSARHKAVQGYRRINEAALRQIKPGGMIFTFSCSQAVDKALFTSTVMAAAIDARRKVRILHQLHQPADHPISMFHPEGEYLKGLVLLVE